MDSPNFCSVASSKHTGKMSEKKSLDESGWSKENLLKLIAAMKSTIPKRYSKIMYSRGLKHVDWNEVAFHPFSAEACQKKWSEILQKMRKTRTLTELMDEAEEIFSSPVPNNRIHPDYVKKPTPSNAIFYEENWVMFRKQYPEMSRPMLLKVIANEYKALPDKEKAQYVEKHKLLSEEYQKKKPPKRKSKNISADVPDGEQHSKDDLPPKPPGNGYHLFCKEQLPSMTGVSRCDYVKVWAQHWRDLTEGQKDEYNARCVELKRKYAAEMNQYLNALDEEEQQQILNENGIKRPKKYKCTENGVKRFPGEPKMPSRASNALFYKNQMELLKEEFPNARQRLVKITHMWQDLSVKEKQCYKLKVDERFRKYLTELQKWFKTLTPAAQDEYRTCNRSKCQYLKAKTKKEELYDKELCPYSPSDSEDESIDISSSEEEVNYLHVDEDEEEEGDMAFEI